MNVKNLASILCLMLGVCQYASSQNIAEPKKGDTVIVHAYRDPGMMIDGQIAGQSEQENTKGKAGTSSRPQRKGKFWYRNTMVTPNPVIFNASINLKNYNRINVEIWDDGGKTVWHRENVNGAALQHLDLSALRAGDYEGRAVIMTGNKVYNFKLSKL